MEDNDLFERALDASAPDVRVDPHFAEQIVARAFASRSHRWQSTALWSVAAAALLVFAGLAHAHRRIEGELEVARDASSHLTRALGHRAVAVLDPGTRIRFAVGGVFESEPDVLWLEKGAVFLRVEPGRAFEVRSQFGNVHVTGTCFRVELRDDAIRENVEEDSMSISRGAQLGSFGLGVLSTAAMMIAVYEGGVRVTSAHGQNERDLGPGQISMIDANGQVRWVGEASSPSIAASPTTSVPSSPAGGPGGSGSSTRIESLSAEIERLNTILERHSISPATGERAREGIDSSGNTDLTREEWRTLAERGELRFRLPGREHDSIRDEMVEAYGLDPAAEAELERLIGQAHERLRDEIGELYREATGLDSAGVSLQAMMSEIDDKSPRDMASHIRWLLAQERAGLAVAPPVTDDMPPYERMMRHLVGFESELESQLAEEVGPETAHSLLFREPSISAHSFGTTGSPVER
jgi:ferric-dicitrate binding protein FerR (iron transport regulator)